MPKGRSTQYWIWRACERFNILPPELSREWDDIDSEHQTLILAYDEIRTREQSEIDAAMAGIKLNPFG